MKIQKFKKKPIEISAEQFLPFEDDMRRVISNIPEVFIDLKNINTMWSIDTLEGRFEVTPTDWIITGVNGEKYPCKNDIFIKTYDKV